MEELDFKKLINIFWNKRLQIAIIVLVSMIIGIVYSFYFIKPKYQAYTTIVLVKNSDDSSKETITTSDVGLAKNLIGTYSKLVKSKTILRETINSLEINESEDTLKSKVSVSEIEDSEMLKITVEDANPVQAMKVANKVTEIFAKKVQEIYKINNVYIVDYAEESLIPSNVNHARDIIIAFVLGIVLSVMYVLVTNMFDNSVKSADDIEANTELITLVSIPEVNENIKKGGIN